MRTRRQFRPAVTDRLEDRAVPSLAAAMPPPLLFGHAAALPGDLTSQAGDRIGRAFDAFVRDYSRAVQSVLLRVGPDGSVDPSVNRPAFDATIDEALATLADNVEAAVSDATSDPEAASQAVAAILGDSSDSLRSQLDALATEAIAQGESIRTLVADTVEQVRDTQVEVTDLLASGLQPVAQAFVASAVTAPTAIVSTPSIVSSSSPLKTIRGALADFMDDYLASAQQVLFAAGADGRVDPAANREAFDDEVAASASLLEARVSAILATDPATSYLASSFEEAIVGHDPRSLANQLAALPTPEVPGAAVVREFTLGSFRAVADLLEVIAGGLAP